MEREAVITCTGLSIGYLNRHGAVRTIVHEALDLQLFRGEMTSLLGLNGAGKSTLLRTLCGFQPPLAGSIQLMGRPFHEYSRRTRAHMVGVVLTEKSHVGGLTVYELVALGRHPYTGFFGQLSSKDRQVVEESIEAVGLMHKHAGYMSELSDGERQKAMIAKVLAQQCEIIVLDEPTAFLDVTGRVSIMTLLHRLAVEQGKAILLSTHDLELAIRMSDCLWLQEQGVPMVTGAPEDLIIDHVLERFFEKEEMCFDPSSGRVTMEMPHTPLRVTGDKQLARWVGNALLRNGYLPTKEGDTPFSIHCEAPDRLMFHSCDGTKEVHRVADLMDLLKEKEQLYRKK